MRTWTAILALTIAACFFLSGNAAAQQVAAPEAHSRQSLDDAWWTGPVLANSAGNLPRGHYLIEPYLFDVIGPHSQGFGNLTYMNYGLLNRFTVGFIPTEGYTEVSHGPSSSGVKMGDVSVAAQYGLTKFHVGHWLPTMAVALQETLPTGKFDRLGTRPSDGLGSGAYATMLSYYTQTYFWMPNGRILRTRFNVSETFSGDVRVKDASVYGTADGFRGSAQPGRSTTIDSSWEYSLTRRWVLAMEGNYRHSGNTQVAGYNSQISNPLLSGVHFNSGSSDTLAFAPAVEYSWKPNLGVLLGLRVIPDSHNTTHSLTPVVAINFFR